jgi:hypothetical protein
LNCPVCAHGIEADFGVVTCGHCNSVLFVDMDGNVQVSSASGDLPGAVATSGPVFEAPVGMDMASLDVAPELDPAVRREESETVVLPDPSPRSLAEEIGDFANSENGTNGALSYWVRIEGIDTKEVRADIERVFSDSKLMLDWRDVVETIENGVLEIKQLNPIKASRLVQKLNELPVRLSWRQSAYDN